jgi:hypothetical protein
MNTPYLQLSEENRQLLEQLQMQDINRLIRHYQLLSSLELTLLLGLGAALLGYLFYLAYNAFKRRNKPTPEASIQYKLNEVNQQQEQPQFLKEAENFIRLIVRERFHTSDLGLTDLELYAFFQGTPLQLESEETLSLIDQGRFGQVQLKDNEKERIKNFLKKLYSFHNYP